MVDDDDIDIYGDLVNFGEKSSDDCSENVLELKKKCVELEIRVINLEKELESLRTTKNTLEVNLSSLVKTAKTEIARKDRMIAELRSELENKVFRRNNYRVPKVKKNIDSKLVPNENSDEHLNDQPVKAKTVASLSNNNTRIYIKPVTTVKNYNNGDEDNDDDNEETYPPNKFTSTVYGDRLRKKLIAQEAAEKLENEQLKNMPSISEKFEIKNEPESNSDNIQRYNNKNQFHRTTSNEDNSENTTNKSLKRPNDKLVSEHCEKRIKLTNYKNDKIDYHENHDSRNMDTSGFYESYEAVNKKNNYYLQPIETRSRISNRKRNGESLAHENFDEKRNNYRDKYRRRYSNSPSSSRDRGSYSDKRKESNNKYRELNLRRDIDNSNQHRSSRDRDQYKYDMHRDPRSRIKKSSSNDRGRVSNMQHYTDHHRQQRSNRVVDHRYERRDDKEPHRKRKRSSGSQHDRDDSYSKDGLKEINNKEWDRCNFNVENSRDIFNVSVSGKTCENQALSSAEENRRAQNEESTSLNSVEEGEIIGSPQSILYKSTVNNHIQDSGTSGDPLKKVLDKSLFSTLSVETSVIEFPGHNASRPIFASPQEEKIENIEAFIRNYTDNGVVDNISSPVKHELFDQDIHNVCTTTKIIAQTLDCEADKVACNKDLGNNQNTLTNHNEKLINGKEKKHQDGIPSDELSLNVTQPQPNISDSPSKPKNVIVETISVNNISTIYANVLSKYVRKKKKSSTNNEDPIAPEEYSDSTSEKRDVKEIEKKIDDQSDLSECSKMKENSVVYDSVPYYTEHNSSESVNKPQIKILCKQNEVHSEDAHNTDDVHHGTIENKVECLNTHHIMVERPIPPHNNESQTKHSALILDNNLTEINHNMKKADTLEVVSEIASAELCTKQDEMVNHDTCEFVKTQEESSGITQNVLEINKKIKQMKSIKIELTRCSNVSSEKTCDEGREENSLKIIENKMNDCNKPVLGIKQKGRKIVVARRQKRPVQLTNSSNSLTVVLSAYNINNNRVCKSKMRTSVTLSDS